MVAAHVFGHHIAGNRARRTAQDDQRDHRLIAEAHPCGDRQKDDRQQDQLDEGCGTSRRELFDRLRTLETRADADEGNRRCAGRQHVQPLGQHGRKIHLQQRKRQTGQNAEDDRVGDNAAQRARYNALVLDVFGVRRGDGQHQHRKDVVERHAGHNHQRHQSRVPVQVLHERHAQNRLRAAKRALRECADHAFVRQQLCCAQPDGKKVNRRHARAEQEEFQVELLGDASSCDVAEQQNGQQHLERQPIEVGERLRRKKVPGTQHAAQQNDCKNRDGCVETEDQIIRCKPLPLRIPPVGRNPVIFPDFVRAQPPVRATMSPSRTRSCARGTLCGTHRPRGLWA